MAIRGSFRPCYASLARRAMLRGTARLGFGGIAAALLAACGETKALPEPPVVTGQRPETPKGSNAGAVATAAREAKPQSSAAVTIGVPTGNFMLDRIALQVAGLASDSRRTAAAPGELRVVQFTQAGGGQGDDQVAAIEAVLPNHPDLDAVLLPDATMALQLADNGTVISVNEAAASSASFDTKDFLPIAIDAVADEGEIFGLPLWVSTNVLQYSEGLFARAGVDPTSLSGWTWDQFLDTARRLTTFDTPNNPSQWGFWMLPGALSSQQWIWQNDGTVIDVDARQATLDTAQAHEAIEFMQRLTTEDLGPRVDFTAGPPPLRFNNGIPSIQGVPVSMYPAVLGGGFGGRGLGVRFAGRPGPGGGGFHRAARSFIQGGRAAANSQGQGGAASSDIDLGRRGILALPGQRAMAIESSVLGSISLLGTSASPDAAFRMMDWVASQISPQAAVPARGASAEQLQSVNNNLNDADAEAILRSVAAGRRIPGRQAPVIGRLMLENVDFPVMFDGEEPKTALATAGTAIDEVLNSTDG